MISGSNLKRESFKCGNCQGPAKIAVSDDDVSDVNRVFCPACGAEVTGDNAKLMISELRMKFVKKESLNIVIREMRKRRMGRIPTRKISNEFSDPRWPFILISVDAD